jgi:hypothetical protein
VYNISLAVLQYSLIYHAFSPTIQVIPNSTYDQYIMQVNMSEKLHLCKNQQIRSSIYHLFSVVDLTVIILGDSLIIFLGNLIPVIAPLGSSNPDFSETQARYFDHT